ncbi:hypothetical protein BFW01_g10945 [Lasiodiplodia theobromae]|uniref:Uncharacterized protein n=1 Tax=Lasiodiplodia theobromae TaxID=45133 RepID=A0A8H7IQ55_9PEZI|nr:hypothetical protein BFW01_g10945 [Lasiodiplodia theobromae]
MPPMSNENEKPKSPAESVHEMPANTKIAIGACVGGAFALLLMLAFAKPFIKRWRCRRRGETQHIY